MWQEKQQRNGPSPDQIMLSPPGSTFVGSHSLLEIIKHLSWRLHNSLPTSFTSGDESMPILATIIKKIMSHGKLISQKQERENIHDIHK